MENRLGNLWGANSFQVHQIKYPDLSSKSLPAGVYHRQQNGYSPQVMLGEMEEIIHERANRALVTAL